MTIENRIARIKDKAQANAAAALMERVVVMGDLSGLNAQERTLYYVETCRSAGLNPLTRPFEYLTLDDKLVLYARKDCTDQLRAIHGVEITQLVGSKVDDLYVVTAHARDNKGRIDAATGAVPLTKEKGEWKTATSGKRYFQGSGEYVALSPTDRANAMMKAETKAKRRVTLSLCGLGVIDESELETIDAAKPVELPTMAETPTPEHEVRAALILDIKRTSAALKQTDDEKKASAREHLGEWKIEEAPLAMVESLANSLRAKLGEVKYGEEVPV